MYEYFFDFEKGARYLPWTSTFYTLKLFCFARANPQKYSKSELECAFHKYIKIYSIHAHLFM